MLAYNTKQISLEVRFMGEIPTNTQDLETPLGAKGVNNLFKRLAVQLGAMFKEEPNTIRQVSDIFFDMGASHATSVFEGAFKEARGLGKNEDEALSFARGQVDEFIKEVKSLLSVNNKPEDKEKSLR